MRLHTRWLLVASLALAACSDDDPETLPTGGPESAQVATPTTAPGEPGPTTESVAPSPAPSTTADEPPTTSGAPGPTDPPPTTITVTLPPEPVVGDPAVGVELVGEFDSPVDLAVRPGDDALWIVEQPGTVVRFGAAGTIEALSLAGRVSGGNEQGLLGLAFSPDGSLAYTNHTDLDGTTVITEWAVAADGRFDPPSERVVLAVDQPFSNHNAGDLHVDADGMLWVPLGDGGSADDPGRRSSDPNSLLGSLLRIDPSPGGDVGYTIPPDNPFATGAHDGVTGAPEVWAWGLRNPWKIDVDPVTGRLWIADVGQNRFEEVSAVDPAGGLPAGFALDFGWSAFEGFERFNRDVTVAGDEIPPVLTYDHGDGCSISGGAVYRGSAIAGLEPAYVYSDFCTSDVWAFDLAAGRNLTLVPGLSQVTAIRSGPDAELYVLQRSGQVLRLVPA